MTQPPCKDCTGRYIGCHSGCQTWKDWKTESDKEKAEIRAARSREEALNDFLMTTSHRTMLDSHRRASKRARS